VIWISNVFVVVHRPSISTLYHPDRIRHPIISRLFPPREPTPANTPFQSHISYSAFGMSDQSGSSHLRVLFEAALEDYTQQTGIELTEHPLAERLQYSDSVESVTDILREQAQEFQEFREKDKVLKPLERVLTVLHRLSSATNFAQDVGLVCPPPPWAPTDVQHF
jgi:predicted ribosome quality control (RQC) complex YloA/Tae2 family protein